MYKIHLFLNEKCLTENNLVRLTLNEFNVLKNIPNLPIGEIENQVIFSILIYKIDLSEKPKLIQLVYDKNGGMKTLINSEPQNQTIDEYFLSKFKFTLNLSNFKSIFFQLTEVNEFKLQDYFICPSEKEIDQLNQKIEEMESKENAKFSEQNLEKVKIYRNILDKIEELRDKIKLYNSGSQSIQDNNKTKLFKELDNKIDEIKKETEYLDQLNRRKQQYINQLQILSRSLQTKISEDTLTQIKLSRIKKINQFLKNIQQLPIQKQDFQDKTNVLEEKAVMRIFAHILSAFTIALGVSVFFLFQKLPILLLTSAAILVYELIPFLLNLSNLKRNKSSYDFGKIKTIDEKIENSYKKLIKTFSNKENEIMIKFLWFKSIFNEIKSLDNTINTLLKDSSGDNGLFYKKVLLQILYKQKIIFENYLASNLTTNLSQEELLKLQKEEGMFKLERENLEFEVRAINIFSEDDIAKMRSQLRKLKDISYHFIDLPVFLLKTTNQDISGRIKEIESNYPLYKFFVLEVIN